MKTQVQVTLRSGLTSTRGLDTICNSLPGFLIVEIRQRPTNRRLRSEHARALFTDKSDLLPSLRDACNVISRS